MRLEGLFYYNPFNLTNKEMLTMKIKKAIILLFLAVPGSIFAQESETDFIKENFEFASKQYKLMMETPSSLKSVMPRTLDKNGNLKKTSIYAWTAGFFPGSLWYLSDFQKDKSLQDSAIVYTNKMKPVKSFTDNHDIGFMMYCSYGNAERFNPKPEYKEILVESARSLCKRFDSKTGVIKSWNGFKSWHGDKVYNFPVIIDNMMNLELLFYASKVTGDDYFKKIAISHAEKTMKNQVRKDYSCFHIVYYDKETGKPIKGETSQGYSDNSAWSRGQAWGIYGFTMCYRETKDPRFLKTAQKMADFYMNHPNLPSDKIAWWDLNANQPGYTPGIRSNANNIINNYRDASAAACIASALLELSTYSDSELSKKYFNCAKTILHSLGSKNYRAKLGENGTFILMHSTGSIPHNVEIDVPLTYADYYFIEALYRYDKLLIDKPIF